MFYKILPLYGFFKSIFIFLPSFLENSKKMEAWIGVEPIYAILQTAA